MTFVYGSYTTVLDSFRPKGIVCPACEKESQMVVEKAAGVIHVMFIPIVPVWITTIFSCKSCGSEFILKDLDVETKGYLKSFKLKKLFPIWLFSGPLLLVIAAGFYGYTQNKDKNEMLERLLNGSQSQIIEYETDEGQFTTMRTLKITSDSAWVNYNGYEIAEYKFIDRITDQKLYGSDTVGITVDVLKEMFEEGQVLAVYPYRPK
jgi:hypothetical protein